MNSSLLRLFSRDAGPIAYEIDLFDGAHLATTASMLLASGLDWHWHGARAPHRPGVAVRERPLTRLTVESAADLVADAAWRDEDDFGCFMALFALLPGAPVDLATSLDAAVQQFLAEREPLRAVVIQVGDAAHELAYVPHDPVPEVVAFLRRAGVGTATDTHKVLPYSRLRTASLEVQLGVDRP